MNTRIEWDDMPLNKLSPCDQFANGANGISRDATHQQVFPPHLQRQSPSLTDWVLSVYNVHTN